MIIFVEPIPDHTSCSVLCISLHILKALRSIPLALLDLLERLHGTVQSVLVVSSELRVCALEGGVSVGFGLVDTIDTALVPNPGLDI